MCFTKCCNVQRAFITLTLCVNFLKVAKSDLFKNKTRLTTNAVLVRLADLEVKTILETEI